MYFWAIFIPEFDLDLKIKRGFAKLMGLIVFALMQKRKRENNKWLWCYIAMTFKDRKL